MPKRLHIHACVSGASEEIVYKNSSILQSLSKLVHWQDIECSGEESELLECQPRRYTGIFNNEPDIVIRCEQGKYMMNST